MKRLEDNDTGIRSNAIEVLGKLADHGECQLENIAVQLTQNYEAEFREAVTTMIPSFIKRLGDKGWYLRAQSFDIIGKLASRGERV
jgi:HEAT repeat protein